MMSGLGQVGSSSVPPLSAMPTDDTLVLQYAPLVKRIAHHLMARLPSGIAVDDLMQAGMIGLLEAARKYQNTRGASFETYAGIRIRGAMLDEVRKGNWTPRSVYRNAREISKAIHHLENSLGRHASDQEVAGSMGIDIDDYHAMLADSGSAHLFSLEELMQDGEMREDRAGEHSPVNEIQAEALRAAVSRAITQLPEKEALVLSLYYDDELNLKEIGLVLGVSESRICQIHSQAMLRLRGRLQDWLGN